MHLRPDSTRQRVRRAIWPVLCGLLALLTLAACTATRPQTDVSAAAQAPLRPTPAPALAPSRSPVPTNTPNDQEIAEAKLTATSAALRTTVALTAAPTRTPGPPPIYPTPTLALGWVPGCIPKNSREPQCTNGWRGMINGELIKVMGGMEGRSGDPTQGLLMIYVKDRPLEIYRTPQKLGAVRVAAVDSTLVILAAVDLRTPGMQWTPSAAQTPGTYFVFDLATRQWVSAGSTMPVATPNYKEVFETHVAETRSARRTTVALTAAPTRTPGPPPPYPTYTPLLGMLGTEPDFSKNPRNPQITSVWRGWIDGGIVQVNAGSEGQARDPLQGLIIVNDWSARTSDTYNTPQRLGPVRLVAVDGTLVTLALVDLRTPGVLWTPLATQTPGTFFVFDLATRRWLSP